MVTGFKNAPMIFQRIMNKIFNDLIGHGIEVYMDDIAIHGKNEEEDNKFMGKVLIRLKINNLKGK